MRNNLLILFWVVFLTNLNAQSPVKLSIDQFKFTEGPVWDGAQFIYFTDIPNSKVIKYSITNNAFSEAFANTNRGNGLMFTKNYELLVCEGSSGKITKRTIDGNILETLVSEYDNKRFNSPNDLCIDAKGGIYFTDPTWSPQIQMSNRLYYRKPNGVIIELDSFGNNKPNGVIISPAGDKLYVNDSLSKNIFSYDIDSDTGTVSNRKTFAVLASPGNSNDTGADGMAVDTEGNLYVTAKKTVQVFDKSGNAINTIDFPEKTTNCTFGKSDKKTLYVTAGKNLYSVELSKTGVQHPFDLPKIDLPQKGTGIPGKVEAEDYDEGGQGKAYSDNDKVNRGKKYRLNEGVDIEGTPARYNVGWIEDNEWIEYTLDVASAGNYIAEFVYASPKSGGSVELRFDNKVKATTTFGNTGEWQKYTTKSSALFALAKGKQVMRVTFVKEGINLDKIIFSKVGEEIEEAPIGKIIAFKPKQNAKANKYVSARFNENNVLKAKAANFPSMDWQRWERFYIENHEKGGVAIKVFMNSTNFKYLQVNGNTIKATAVSKNDNSTRFIWEKIKGNLFGLKSSNGKYVQAPHNLSEPTLNVNGNALGDWESFEYTFVTSAKSLSSKENLSIEVYPDPVKDVLHIQSAKQGTNYKLFDLTGKEIARGRTQGQIDVSNIVNGIYILHFNNEKSIQFKKVRIE